MTHRALLAALIIAAFIAGRATATPRPASQLATPVVTAHGIEGRTGAPQLLGPGVREAVGSAGTRADVESGGVPPPPVDVVHESTSPAGTTSRFALTGTASWYCLSKRSPCTVGYPAPCLCAAAGPALRVGDWRGRLVTVMANGRSVTVRLVDTMANRDRLLDLYASAFIQLAPLSRGLVRVTITPG